MKEEDIKKICAVLQKPERMPGRFGPAPEFKLILETIPTEASLIQVGIALNLKSLCMQAEVEPLTEEESAMVSAKEIVEHIAKENNLTPLFSLK